MNGVKCAFGNGQFYIVQHDRQTAGGQGLFFIQLRSHEIMTVGYGKVFGIPAEKSWAGPLQQSLRDHQRPFEVRGKLYRSWHPYRNLFPKTQCALYCHHRRLDSLTRQEMV